MNDENEIPEEPREEIARLEGRIEELAEHIERCHKLGLLSQVIIAGSVLCLLAGALGIVGLGPGAAVGSIAALLGGIVLGGSNRSSMQQIKSALAAAEARRAGLIGAIEMRTVSMAADPQNSGQWLH